MKKITSLFAILSLTTLIFTAACKKEAAPQTNTETPKPEASKTADNPEISAVIDFSTNPKEVTSNQQTELSFTVKNSAGEIIKDLKIVHEKPMHLIVVSSDLNEFYHIHPEPQGDGSFKVPFAFPNGGKYKLFLDATFANGKPLLRSMLMDVKGEPAKAGKLTADSKFETAIGGINVSMTPDGEILAGKPMLLNFNVIDIATRQTPADMQNYLGEKAHFVVISENLKEFVHAHPMSKKVSGDHSEHSQSANSEKMPEMKSDAFISAHITFPEPGLYKLWAQFQRNGRVIDVPFVINVKQDKEQAKLEASADIPKDAYRVTVSKEGFMPSEISFAAGEFKKLAFVRIDSDNCADEVIFKDLNITKKLPVGEIVYVDLPGDSKGKTYSFECGMNMFKGKVVVQ